MRRCVKCKSKFSYKELMKFFWGYNYNYLVCKNCKEKYDIKIISRIAFAILLVAVPISLIQALGISDSIATIGYLIYSVILILLSPIFVIFKLKDKK